MSGLARMAKVGRREMSTAEDSELIKASIELLLDSRMVERSTLSRI